ncbi:unnamed protein product [Acanthoscelides obtectus]|uniref:Regulation of nuclear pre-mRNA domain-containing protein 2 n=1 Tax=Acanthoscelides obtectus TaxID=200917 RepID=A0A9P0KV19_ACAOB|nr:unnamed protein product [Acanthoscelides obtectus]CAK1657780.1 Regulation of nuclear pre-mRNA domain-containing protein 2 [Acanthoscelides obtectus]
MGTQNATESEFNVLQFEKQLMTLKDSQEAINHCCQWCLQNRGHHKKIVSSWLNVLKRVKVEQRLILFYLANDVVQYSKRRNYEYVESWGTALQKATTMVRDDKVKNKILRIFKIWEQRNVYNEEFISDLCGLLSITPTAQKSDEPHEFQPSYVINKIKICTKLERDTDTKLKLLKEHNPKIQIDDGLIGSLKDRAHVDDVEKEVEVYVKHMEEYISALKLEIKNRITLIGVLKQADTQLEADRKDVKVVANAYKMFGTRVKTFQRKLDEHKATLTSPIPSPDINAPSPSPDSDIDLPDEPPALKKIAEPEEQGYNPKADLEKRIKEQQQVQYTNAGFYNVATAEETPVTNTSLSNSFINSSFLSNGFSSYIGSDISVNLSTLEGSIFSTSASQSSLEAAAPSTISNSGPTPVPPVQQQPPTTFTVYGGQPLLPPPMPPFSKPDGGGVAGRQDYGAAQTDAYSTQGYASSGGGGTTNSDYANGSYSSSVVANTPVDQPPPSVAGFLSTTDMAPPFLDENGPHPPEGCNPYPPAVCTIGGDEEYNPEEDVSLVGWDGLGPEDGCFGLDDVASPFPDAPPSHPPDGCNPYPPEAPANNQEHITTEKVPLLGWENQGGGWPSQPPDMLLDTPESPPNFEKEGYGDPVEYRDGDGSVLDAHTAAAGDVDHRVMPRGMGDHIEDSMGSLGGKDVDHRNLISLTGSPGNSNSQNSPQNWNNGTADQDYRLLPPTATSGDSNNHHQPGSAPVLDHDYRMGFNLEQLKLPPPPPPPPSNKFGEPPPPLPPDAMLKSPPPQPPPPLIQHGGAGDQLCDGIDMDNIDMDLSDEDAVQHTSANCGKNENLKVIVDPSNSDSPQNQQNMLLEPPPPLPDLPDDVDANNFLDDLSNDLHEFESLSADGLDTSSLGIISSTDVNSDKGGIFSTPSMADPPPQGVPPPTWQPSGGQAPMLPPPSLAGFNDMLPMAMPPPPMGSLLPIPQPQQPYMGEAPPSWPMDDDMQQHDWMGGGLMMEDRDQQSWQQPPPHLASPHNGQFMQFGRGGRGMSRGSPGFNKRGGRGRGGNRGGGNMMFRGGGVNSSPRGGQKGNRGGPQQWNNNRGLFHRNFRGGF